MLSKEEMVDKRYKERREKIERREKMERREKSRIGKVFLALVLTASMLPVSAVSAEAVNLALNKPVTATNDEGQGNTPDKAVDGNLSTRWATGQNMVENQHIDIDLEAQNDIKQVIVNFERTDEAQNILGFTIELDNGNGFEEAYRKEAKAKQKEVITFDEVKQASKVRVKVLNADGGENNWANVSICEIEVYSDIHDINPEATENVNHIRNSTVTTSSNEVAALNGDKVKDGDYTSRSGRWASDYEKPTTNIWLNAEFNKLTLVKELDVYFFGRDVDPMPSNVESFSIKYTDQNGEEKYALQDYQNTVDGDGFATDVKITLDEPIIAKDITLCDFLANATSYNNISIAEFEVFSNEQSEKVTLDSVVSDLEKNGGTTIAKDVDTLELPSVPEGYSVTFNCADFEEIINDQAKVFLPLVDKTVQVSFIVTNNETGETKTTADIPFIVEGKNEQLEENNAKPVIIPEIAEWYSNNTDILAVREITTVTYDNDELSAIVDEFIADYQDFSGIKLSKEKGSATANAFNFSKQAPDEFLGEEGYTMDIHGDRVVVKSNTVTGNMYAMQTILQMYKQNSDNFSVGSIRDYPRFASRGFLFDVARKPVSMEMIKDVSRTMRYYKMNDLQIHLSDNYIFLEQYGKGENENEAFKAYEAFRLESGLTNEAGESPTATDYSISKADFQDFIKSERELGMKIVPEIDVPAHSTSFTKIWPELMVKDKVSPLNGNRPLVDHFDVSKPEAIAKIKEIFDDYTKGNNPTFDSETTIHIGADEFLENYTAYREFLNELVPYVKDTNTVRMWGGLTWINDGKTEIIQEAIENVEMNLWSRDWADGKQMYDMGYKLINTIDSYGYMVPNGNFGRGSYQDLLNRDSVFNNFAPNLVSTGSGWQYIPSGDDQMLGAAFALWSDNIDKSASGLSESDLYWRFFDAMPVYAEKTWASTGKEKGTINNLTEIAEEQGIGPRTNPYYQEDSVEGVYEEYEFTNNELADSSQNNRDLEIGQGNNAVVENETLKLTDDSSYATSPIDVLGNGNELSFDITLTEPAAPGDILFEADAPYGSHDIRIMEDCKLGFTRELYNYYFDYELPTDKKVNIKIVVDQQITKLYVDGEFAGSASGKYIHNDIVKKVNISNATFALPLERIGSKTNAIAAIIDNVSVKQRGPAEDVYNKAGWTGEANTETVYNEVEGVIEYAFDNNPTTRWHSNWQGASDKLTGENEFYAEIDFGQAYRINQFSFTPRTDTASGQVTKADLYIKGDDSPSQRASGEWQLVAENQTFAADATKKTFMFEEQDVRYVKFVAKASNDGWVAISEFDIANKEQATVKVYAGSQPGGIVEGTQEVLSGTEVTIKATANSGYQFAGWYRTNGIKVSDDVEYTFIANSNCTLIAHFEEDGTQIMHTVIIDDQKMQVAHGVLIERPQDPVKEGYKFVGWFAGDKEYDFSEPVVSNLEITAKFVPVEAAEVDKTALQAIVDQVKEMDSADYTIDSWANVVDALAEAEIVLANEKALQAEVDNAIKALSEAIDGLAKPTDKIPSVQYGDKTSSVSTGDNVNMSVPMAGLVLAGAVLIKRKKKIRKF